MYKKMGIFITILIINMLLINVWDYSFYEINFQKNEEINFIIVILQSSLLIFFLMVNLGTQEEKLNNYNDFIIIKQKKKKFYLLNILTNLKYNTIYFLCTYIVIISFEEINYLFNFLLLYLIILLIINILNIVELYLGEITSIVIVSILIVFNIFIFDKNNMNSIFLIKAYYVFPTLFKLELITILNIVLGYVLFKISINKSRLGG